MATKIRFILVVLLFVAALPLHAQIETVADTLPDTLSQRLAPPMMSSGDSTYSEGIRSAHTVVEPNWEDSLAFYREKLQQFRLTQLEQQQQNEQLQQDKERLQQRVRKLSQLNDSLVISNERYQQSLQEKNAMLENMTQLLQEKEKLMAEKDALNTQLRQSSSLDSAKFLYQVKSKEADIAAKQGEIDMLRRNIDTRDASLQSEKLNYERLAAERQQCMRIVDSLREMVVKVEKENVRKDEENKYLAQRAKEAEEKVATATNRKKKVRPVQGIAMRFYRTPNWNIRITPVTDDEGNTTNMRQIWNRNAGNIEFDYITGASVMLWDMSKYFNKQPDTLTLSNATVDLRKFDQQFAYDLGVYVGFGGSNLFKNFYVGPSFRFMDFFYLVVGVNVCEYEVLSDGYKNNQILTAGEALDNVISKTWLVKPFVALSIDLDFLSFIKK